MSLGKRLFHRTNLKTKQFTGDNGGNAVVGIPENAEFNLADEIFISTNTSVYIEIMCRKDPYQDFEAVDNETKKDLPILPVKKLRERTVIRVLPGKNGYEADIYNERNDQAIRILVGPENKDNLNLLLDMIKSAKFI
ncbi:hypothetical protein MmiHf6_09390 [Methanimicrococcus hongohii]|uniref:Uncharacterized protein n=1 Tax=Methanimicrococcus hongohii TaxID=3028295 RepID=A0AA96ZSP3_9EURY|nr:hypothetical protein [Methanimicrococcus sp. Hf6]WNY23630.1 hypothetical protein MmiHf6_09390 [Methanimicrococcus sp. Hf6]